MTKKTKKTYNTPTGYRVIVPEDLKYGLEVRDVDGYTGIITSCEDIEAFTVKYDVNGFGEYTLKKSEDYYLPIYTKK